MSKPKILTTRIPPEIAQAVARRYVSRSPSKYHAEPATYRGVRYDSKAEAHRAFQLDCLVKSGDVAWWLRQVPVMVGEPGVDRPYRVDFLVCQYRRSTVWPERFEMDVHAEDVKGMETASFRRHVRQWRLRGPFLLHVISRTGTEIIPKGTEA